MLANLWGKIILFEGISVHGIFHGIAVWHESKLMNEHKRQKSLIDNRVRVTEIFNLLNYND